MKEPMFQIWWIGDNLYAFGTISKITDLIFLLECKKAKHFVPILYNTSVVNGAQASSPLGPTSVKSARAMSTWLFHILMN
jgi:hypothetical protein